MKFFPLDIYEPVFHTKARYIDLWGGRGRGGSYFASQYMIFRITQPEYFRGFVSRAIYRDIESSIWQELLDRIEENEDLEMSDFQIKGYAKMTYVPTGWTITSKGFNSGSSGRTANLKGFAGATHIVIDEAEEITEPQQNQLDDTFRTIKAQIQIFRVFNPPSKDHFIIKNDYDLTPAIIYDKQGKEVEGFYNATPKPGNSNHLNIFATYLDNWDNINQSSKEKYASYEITNPDYYYVQICGLVPGGAKGVIFKYPKDWWLYDKLPEFDFWKGYGLDFGGGGGTQTDEPDGTTKSVLLEVNINKSAISETKKSGSVYVKLHLYKGYISTDDLCSELDRTAGKTYEVLADNARADKITELANKGYMVIPAKTKEGKSSQVVTGYDILKNYNIFVYEKDKPVQVELNNHKWKLNAITKEPTGQPEDKFKDILDALRYIVVYYHLNYNY